MRRARAQAAAELEKAGVAEGRGKLLNNLAAALLQQDRPLAALRACAAALEVRAP